MSCQQAWCRDGRSLPVWWSSGFHRAHPHTSDTTMAPTAVDRATTRLSLPTTTAFHSTSVAADAVHPRLGIGWAQGPLHRHLRTTWLKCHPLRLSLPTQRPTDGTRLT
jgi:hypothetical protein